MIEIDYRSDEILKEVQTSLDKLKTMEVELSSFLDIYGLTMDGTISPYIVMCLKGFYLWYIRQHNRRTTDGKWLYKAMKNEYLCNHLELWESITKLLEEYVRRD